MNFEWCGTSRGLGSPIGNRQNKGVVCIASRWKDSSIFLACSMDHGFGRGPKPGDPHGFPVKHLIGSGLCRLRQKAFEEMDMVKGNNECQNPVPREQEIARRRLKKLEKLQKR